MDPYELIELYGLTETAHDLPIPDDETLAERSVREAFEALFAPLLGTGLELEIEPIAHGLATVLHRRRDQTDEDMQRRIDTLQARLRSFDGSEVSDVEITTLQRGAERLRDIRDGLAVMAEAAARCYEMQIGKVYLPPPGGTGRTHGYPQVTGAMIEARAWLTAHERQEATRYVLEGIPVAVAGDPSWADDTTLFDVLDRVQDRFRKSHGSPIILYHKGYSQGVDVLAAEWARRRKVAQVTFQPNFRAFNKAALFKANDQMFETPKALGGVVIFGNNGVALNLAQKAAARGITVMHVREPRTKT